MFWGLHGQCAPLGLRENLRAGGVVICANVGQNLRVIIDQPWQLFVRIRDMYVWNLGHL